MTISVQKKQEIVGLETKEKSYFHQVSLDCIEKLVECMESIDIEEMDCDNCLKMQEILSNEIDGTVTLSTQNSSPVIGSIILRPSTRFKPPGIVPGGRKFTVV